MSLILSNRRISKNQTMVRCYYYIVSTNGIGLLINGFSDSLDSIRYRSARRDSKQRFLLILTLHRKPSSKLLARTLIFVYFYLLDFRRIYSYITTYIVCLINVINVIRERRIYLNFSFINIEQRVS